MSSKSVGLCIVVWIGQNRQMAVAKRMFKNKIQWLKMSDGISPELIVDEEFQDSTYKSQNVIAEAPMQLVGLSEQMIQTVLNNPICSIDKHLTLTQLSPWMTEQSLSYWIKKLSIKENERPAKKLKIEKNTKFDLLSNHLLQYVTSFLVDIVYDDSIPILWTPDIPSDQWCILNLLMIKSSLYKKRYALFCNQRLRIRLSTIQKVQSFSVKGLVVHNGHAVIFRRLVETLKESDRQRWKFMPREDIRNITANDIPILRDMVTLRELKLMVFVDTSLDQLTQIHTLSIEATYKKNIFLPPNLVNLHIASKKKIVSFQGIYFHLTKLKLRCDDADKFVSLDFSQFPVLKKLELRQCSYTFVDNLPVTLIALSFKMFFKTNLNMLSSNLLYLHIDYYSNATLLALQHLKLLRELVLNDPYLLCDIDAIVNFQHLTSLALIHASAVKKIDALLTLPCLVNLDLIHSKNLNFEILLKHPKYSSVVNSGHHHNNSIDQHVEIKRILMNLKTQQPLMQISWDAKPICQK